MKRIKVRVFGARRYREPHPRPTPPSDQSVVLLKKRQR
jgi:hypothetical protein